MPTLPVYNLNKEKVGTINLSDAIFGTDVHPYLLNEAVRAQIAWRYERKTANAKTRGEVRGTTKKVYRQKGTGQARHGALTAPIFVGGGKSFGPRPHLRTWKLNKKVARSALVSALSQHVKGDTLYVVDRLELEKHSTKQVSKSLTKTFGLKSALVVNPNKADGERVFNRSMRNVPTIKHLEPGGVNVFDVMKFKSLVLSQKAVEQLTERLKDA